MSTFLEQLGQALANLRTNAQVILTGQSLYQLAAIIGIFGAAHLLHLMLGPRLEAWMRSLEGRPKWQLRALLLIRARIRLTIYVVILWIVVLVMREVTWPSRSYLLGFAANLGTAWLLIGFASRLIANRAVRRLTSWAAWTFATLQILGLWGDAELLLDSIALSFGGFRLSLLLVLKGFFVTLALFVGARLVTSTAEHQISSNPDISPSMQVLLTKVVQIALYGAAAYVGLQSTGIDLSNLALLSGAIGVGLGFGLQKIVSNFVSGFILLLDKSIKPGDVISLGDTFGWIQNLSARYVSVVTRDGREYLIPNEDLITNQVVNWTHSDQNVRLDIHFGTSYGDNPHVVRKIAIAAAASVDRVLAQPLPVCHITGFGDSSVDYVLRFWIDDPNKGLTNVRGNVFLALWDALKDNGVSIPFPQREVRLHEGATVGVRQADG